jgi:endonuclease/exonuclease/phosphatase family metal-dependent hydrolase
MTTWTITTWNVHGSTRPSIDALAEAISTESPDVVAVQEIRACQARSLARTLAMRRVWALKHFPYSPLVFWAGEGLALLSPHRLSDAGHVELSLNQRPWDYRRRIALWCDVERDGERLRVYDVHLDSEPDVHERRAQASRLAHLVATHAAPRVVIAGDLNDDTDTAVIDALPGIEHVDPLPPTNPATVPTKRLDHVLMPPDATAVSVTVPGGGDAWAELSDHLPVTARFTLG